MARERPVDSVGLLPLGWQVSGLYRFDELWIALGEGSALDDYPAGQYAERCGG